MERQNATKKKERIRRDLQQRQKGRITSHAMLTNGSPTAPENALPSSPATIPRELESCWASLRYVLENVSLRWEIAGLERRLSKAERTNSVFRAARARESRRFSQNHDKLKQQNSDLLREAEKQRNYTKNLESQSIKLMKDLQHERTKAEKLELDLKQAKSKIQTKDEQLRKTLKTSESEKAKLSKELGCSKDIAEKLKRKLEQANSTLEKQANRHKMKSLESDAAELRKELEHARARELELKEKLDQETSQCRALATKFDMCRRQRELAERQALQAEEDRVGLFRALQESTRRRGDYSNSGHASSFPNGEQLILRTCQLQEYCCDFFDDVADLLDGAEHHLDQSLSRELVLNQILAPCAKRVSNVVDYEVKFKTKLLTMFVDDETQSDSRLFHVFWTSTMQRLASKFRSDRDFLNVSFSENKLRNLPYLKWVHKQDVVNHEDMEGRNVGTLMDEFFLLSFECSVSDPKCMLFPQIGEPVPFVSKKYHNQFFYSQENATAAAGDLVHVVFPGLYNGDPRVEPNLEPVVPAKVVFFRDFELSKARSSPQVEQHEEDHDV